VPPTQVKAPLRELDADENLLAVRHALALAPGDFALSFAAAGDQPLAMLEFVQNVVVVDSEPTKLRYLRGQADVLAAGDYLSFLRPDLLVKADPSLAAEWDDLGPGEPAFEQKRQYFSLKRLTAIRQNLGRLIIAGETVTIGEALQLFPFNKAYLTKLHGYSKADLAEHSLLTVCARLLQPNGLAYVSNVAARPDFSKFMRHLGLAVEEHLTAVARALEPKWQPTVFRKTELI
jgi:hypothetical protein